MANCKCQKQLEIPKRKKEKKIRREGKQKQKLLTYAAYFAGLLSGCALAVAPLASLKCATACHTPHATRDTRQFPSAAAAANLVAPQVSSWKSLNKREGGKEGAGSRGDCLKLTWGNIHIQHACHAPYMLP